MAASDQVLTISGLYYWLKRVFLPVIIIVFAGLLFYSYHVSYSYRRGRTGQLVLGVASLPCDHCMPMNSTSVPAGSRARRFPQAIIIGVRKGGTRALIDMLQSHPDIESAKGEVHYFDDDEHYAMGLEWYISRMALTAPGQTTIEKSPSYFITRDVPQRMYMASRDLKLILIVREPVERAISDFTQLDAKKKTKKMSRSTFEDIVFLSNGEVNTSKSPILVSMYDTHMERWLTYFKLEQIHIVNGDTLIQDPASELQRVEGFLGIRRFFEKDMFLFNKEKGFFCWSRPTKKSWKTAPRCLGSGKGRMHPNVSEETIAKLKEFFKPHNERFYELVHQDFGW